MGLRAGTGVRVKQINVIYEISILDSGVVVAFNNDFRYIDYFLSSGLRFQYEF
ncbi:MAG: hypothetical protein JNM39_13725 [Bdellovibrionaceae bacterium]|nr:hypothetical protein [Pseudobdellovibrionaceae bacterium]